jgi:hypothetical protein
VLGDDLCGQGPDDSSLGRVAVLVEPVCLRLGLLHRSDNEPSETTCPRASPIDFVTARTVTGSRSSDSWVTFDLDFVRVRERLYDIAASLHHASPTGEWREPRRLLDAYERTAPEPLTRDEHRWLPGALALIPLHWAATAGLVGDDIPEAERAMTAAETWWSRRAELSS